mmetsp:Transcript_30376/g.51765  ORF Transcript_30376/g.51765 Transcript_30376/m.51765 type:complete len:257 (-) Transcript_30376:223-993(-)
MHQPPTHHRPIRRRDHHHRHRHRPKHHRPRLHLPRPPRIHRHPLLPRRRGRPNRHRRDGRTTPPPRRTMGKEQGKSRRTTGRLPRLPGQCRASHARPGPIRCRQRRLSTDGRNGRIGRAAESRSAQAGTIAAGVAGPPSRERQDVRRRRLHRGYGTGPTGVGDRSRRGGGGVPHRIDPEWQHLPLVVPTNAGHERRHAVPLVGGAIVGTAGPHAQSQVRDHPRRPSRGRARRPLQTNVRNVHLPYRSRGHRTPGDR